MLKPWREVAVPHEDVLKGTFQQAEFAADLSRVHDGTATAEYQNAELFFQRTFITEGMRLLLDSVVRRLAGRGGDPVIQLQTAFGGGKTHTLLAVYHLARGEASAGDLPGVAPVLNGAGVVELPPVRTAVLDGNKFAPNAPRQSDGIKVHTLWGELARQLGGEAGYQRVRDADVSGTSPGKQILAELLDDCSPCVVLMDELVAYIRQFEEGKSLAGGTYESNLSFVQALTESFKAVPTAVLLASLPESDKEAGGVRGHAALKTLEHYFGRTQALWKPVGSEEAFEIVRRRLFSKIDDRAAAEAVCRAFADYYTAQGTDFPQETQESRYYARLTEAYPIHPEVFDRLYGDWSSLDNFQRTRGVLKLMAKVIHRLWKDGNNDLMILPGSLPLYDPDTRNEAIYYLPQGWDPVLENDIDGERAQTTAIENKETRLGAVQACRRAARTIFLGSAPTTPNQLVRGLEIERVILGCAEPGRQTGVFKDALARLTDRLHYLNSADHRFWFDTRPNLRREMEERKKRFKDGQDVLPVIREGIQKSLPSGVFGGVHVFTPSGDIPDDQALRLVVLSPETPFSRTENRFWKPTAEEILLNRGDQPRHRQNRLLFLAADFDNVGRLKDQVRSMLAWKSIVTDYRENRLVLDNLMAAQAEAALKQALEAFKKALRETYKWVLAPGQEAQPGKGVSEIFWEHFPINSGAANPALEIEKVLKENVTLILEWAPYHLSKMMKQWFWKEGVPAVGALEVWQAMCSFLYLDRLKDEDVFRAVLTAGSESSDFFGLAQGKEGDKYLGFSLGKATSPVLDNSLLLIEPETAAAYADAEAASKEGKTGIPGDPYPEGTPGGGTGVQEPGAPGYNGQEEDSAGEPPKKRFYGSLEIDPVKAKKQFSDMVDEVLMQFSTRPDVKLRIVLELEAESPSGFDGATQRTVKENCGVLKFRNAEFEKG